MPKRSRGTGRPGQRPPIQRSGSQRSSSTVRPINSTAAAPARPSRPPGSLTADEEARAAELEAQILAEERAASETQRLTRDRARGAALAGPRGREVAPLAVAAASEYAYVRRDIVRITRVAALLLATLVVLHVLINVMGVIRV